MSKRSNNNFSREDAMLDKYFHEIGNEVLITKDKEVHAFYIDFVTIEGEESYTHQDDNMCTADGVKSLLRCHKNYLKLEKKLNSFTLKNKLILTYGGLFVSSNKSSNLKRRR